MTTPLFSQVIIDKVLIPMVVSPFVGLALAITGGAMLAGEAIQALGGNGYINDYPTGRLWRDAKLYEIGAGTSEIRRMLIGREIFEATA